MKRLFDLLKSERPLVAGAFGRLAEDFGLDRTATRIIGFVILWASPYWFGASVLDAWWLSILVYIGFALIIRRVSYFRRNRYPNPARRWKEHRCTVITNQNIYDCNGRVAGVNQPPQEMKEPRARPFGLLRRKPPTTRHRWGNNSGTPSPISNSAWLD